uniref:Uncharacterized protein n=1 Tax=Oryza punctata TaxID=4537 RepID=A0A0E0JJZ9_ORYPU
MSSGRTNIGARQEWMAAPTLAHGWRTAAVVPTCGGLPAAPASGGRRGQRRKHTDEGRRRRWRRRSDGGRQRCHWRMEKGSVPLPEHCISDGGFDASAWRE